MCIDQSLERRLLVIGENLGGLFRRRLQPIFINRGGVKGSLELIRREILPNQIWGMDVGIGFGRISTGIFQDNLYDKKEKRLATVYRGTVNGMETARTRRASRMLWEEVGHIPNLAVDNDPAV